MYNVLISDPLSEEALEILKIENINVLYKPNIEDKELRKIIR